MATEFPFLMALRSVLLVIFMFSQTKTQVNHLITCLLLVDQRIYVYSTSNAPYMRLIPSNDRLMLVSNFCAIVAAPSIATSWLIQNFQ